MSENLPVLAPLRTSQELVNPVTDSWAEMLPQVAELARAISNTDFVPAALRNNIAGTTAAILYNREIGLPPMTGLQAVHVIKGKVGISAEMMRAQVFAAGHEIWFEETNTSFCVISGRRAGSDRVTTVKYSESDAKTAGLFSNDNYKKNPRRMYQARATSELCALIFPDVIRGMVSSEELYDDAEAGDSVSVPAEGGTTVQRKPSRPRRASPAALEAAREVPLPEPKTDDGAGSPAGFPPAAGGASSAPSSSLPPLPGEDGYDEPSAAATAESDAGVAAAASSADGETRVHAAPASTPVNPVTGCTCGGPDGVDHWDAPPGPDHSTFCAIYQPVSSEALHITSEQTARLAAGMKAAGITRKQEALDYVMSVIERDVASREELTRAEANRVITALAKLVESEQSELPVEGEEDLPPEVEQEDRPRMITRAQQRGMFGTFNTLGINDDEERLRITAAIVGRTPMHAGVPSSNGLTEAEFKTLVDALARCKTREHVDALVELAVQERAQGGEQ